MIRYAISSILLLSCCLSAWAQDNSPPEYRLKAAVLYNFAKFVEWPTDAFPDTNSLFCIGVLGEDPFHGEIEATVKDKNVSGRPVVVRHCKNATEGRSCHILFISQSERRRLGPILATLKGAPTLTVSELERFLQAGGMVLFTMEQHRVRFEINDAAARAEGLHISSKLLNLAKRIEREATKP